MKRFVTIPTMLLVLSMTPSLFSFAAVDSPSAPTGGQVVMKRDLSIPDPAPDGFAALTEKQVLPCIAILNEGYLVVAPDSKGNARSALLSRRDEWGRPTAETWIHVPTLATNTLVVNVPVPLKPGHIPLQQGTLHLVSARDEKGWTLDYRFAGLNRQIPLTRTDADFVPPPQPETDPFKLQVQKLEGLLKESRDREAALVESLERSKNNATHVSTLLRDIAVSKTEVARLSTETAEVDRMCKDLAGHTPELKAVPVIQKELNALIKEQAQLTTLAEKTRMETEPLQSIQKAVATLQQTLQDLKTSASAGQAELRGLIKTVSGENIREDKEALANLFEKADRQRTRMGAEVQHMEAAKGILTKLYDQTAQLTQDNQKLLEKLQTAKMELQELKKKIQELQQPPPSAPAATAAPEK